MTADDLIEALCLPAATTVGQRVVPKKDLIEGGSLKGRDAKLVRESIEKIHWVAVLKPETVGIRASLEEGRDVSEISILSLMGREARFLPRIEELVHRSITYHLLVLSTAEGDTRISVARKRHSRAEKGAVVIEGEVTAFALSSTEQEPVEAELLKCLDIAAVRHRDLAGLYEYWVDLIVSIEAARVAGNFALSPNPSQARAREQALREYSSLTAKEAALRKRADKATQASARLEINTELQTVRKSLDTAVRILTQEETDSR